MDVVGALSDRPVLATLYGSYGRYRYDGTDFPGPGLPGEREDSVYEVGGTAELPIGDSFAAVVDLRWHETSSNVAFYEWDDLQAGLGIQYRF
jgi:hypothetical protein